MSVTLTNKLETIVDDSVATVRRLQVPGGWAVFFHDKCLSEVVALFIVDQDWSWKLSDDQV